MNTCKTCKWWYGGEAYERFSECPEGWEFVRSCGEKFETPCVVCVKDDRTANFGICRNPKLMSDSVISWEGRKFLEHNYDGVMANCDEERAHLSVGCNFGCIHHQPI